MFSQLYFCRVKQFKRNFSRERLEEIFKIRRRELRRCRLLVKIGRGVRTCFEENNRFNNINVQCRIYFHHKTLKTRKSKRIELFPVSEAHLLELSGKDFTDLNGD